MCVAAARDTTPSKSGAVFLGAIETHELFILGNGLMECSSGRTVERLGVRFLALWRDLPHT